MEPIDTEKYEIGWSQNVLNDQTGPLVTPDEDSGWELVDWKIDPAGDDAVIVAMWRRDRTFAEDDEGDTPRRRQRRR